MDDSGVSKVGISYKPLWITLIKRDMTKGQLRVKAGISTRALAKLGKGEDVNTIVLRRICSALECPLSDIVEIVPDEADGQEILCTNTKTYGGNVR